MVKSRHSWELKVFFVVEKNIYVKYYISAVKFKNTVFEIL